MKRIIVFMMLAAMLSSSVTGCGGGSGNVSAPAQPANESAANDQKAEDQDAEDASSADGADEDSKEAQAADPGESTADPGDVDPAANAPLSEVYTKISSLVELKSPVEMPESFLTNTYGIDTGSLEDFLLVVSEDAASAETIAILKAKDEAGLTACTEALGVLIEEKSLEMENYIPEQYKLVSGSSVKTKGNIAYLVISENEKDITAIIEENIP